MYKPKKSFLPKIVFGHVVYPSNREQSRAPVVQRKSNRGVTSFIWSNELHAINCFCLPEGDSLGPRKISQFTLSGEEGSRKKRELVEKSEIHTLVGLFWVSAGLFHYFLWFPCYAPAKRPAQGRSWALAQVLRGFSGCQKVGSFVLLGLLPLCSILSQATSNGTSELWAKTLNQNISSSSNCVLRYFVTEQERMMGKEWMNKEKHE